MISAPPAAIPNAAKRLNAALTFRAQARNNAWSNHRLLSACAQLSPDDLAAPRVGFFPSIIHTLNHILIVDWFYVSALEGASIGPAAFDPEVPCPAFGDLDREQRAVDRRLTAVCDGLDDDALAQPIEMIRAAGVQRDRADRILLHLFEHQIHHRGQVHTMLSDTSVPPPQLDEYFCANDAHLRADDFAALGFKEDDVWK